MTIPASELVDLQPRTLGGGLASIELNGLLLSNSADLPANVMYPFGSPDAVSNYFGAESAEASLANGYFLADDTSRKARLRFIFIALSVKPLPDGCAVLVFPQILKHSKQSPTEH